ncbi:MAG: 6-aminohexanoate hydrolase [Chloroflexi bacterium]|nr:MAG: 6-aminohexanoate hydrolase [Chloroflexota bacterium]
MDSVRAPRAYRVLGSTRDGASGEVPSRRGAAGDGAAGSQRPHQRRRNAPVEGHAAGDRCAAGARCRGSDGSAGRESSPGQAGRSQDIRPPAALRPRRSSQAAPRPDRARDPVSDPATNDLVHPVARTVLPDGRVLEFDFPGLEIGVAEYDEGPTGCTVFHLPKVASLAIDVRGGSPGVNGQHLDAINAICFAGGSLYGLEASTGVAAELFKIRGYSTKWIDIALVSGAIIFDYGTRANAIYPDKELGRAAVRAMRQGRFPLGARGAGRSATASHGTGAELAGQGGAYRESGQTKILAFVVVNAYGCLVDRSGKIVRGRPAPPVQGRTPRAGNTTLSLVVTNQKLDRLQLQSVGRQVHASMGRGIQPFHARWDGDVNYMVSTQEVTNDDLDEVTLGELASEAMWDAILASYDLATS